MPTYEYRCGACQHEFEQFQSITAKALKKCPACGKGALVRLIGTGAGVLFKGDGFYQTDYRSESYRKAAEAEKPKTDAAAKSEPPKSETPAKSEPAPQGSSTAAEASSKPVAEKASRGATKGKGASDKRPAKSA